MKQLITFYLSLQRPLAVPPDTGYIGLREEPVPWLSEGPWPPIFRPLQETYFQRNRNLVIFQVIQKVGQEHIDFSQLNEAIRLAEHDMGRDADPNDERGPELIQEAASNQKQLLATIMKMTTVLLPTDDNSQRHAISNAFDRCLQELSSLELAYCLTTQDIVYQPTTRNSSTSQCPYFLTDAEREGNAGPYLFLSNDAFGQKRSLPTMLSPDQIEDVRIRQSLHKAGAMQAMYAQWLLNAKRALWTDGDYGASVFQAYTASEIFLDSVLLMIAWEEIDHTPGSNLTLEEVALWVSRRSTIATRVSERFKEHVQPWGVGHAKNPIEQWRTFASDVRNKVIHTGYVPAEAEARRVYEIVVAVERHVKDVLLVDGNRVKYPRTALLQMGRDGVQRRNKYFGKLKQLDEASMEESWLGEFRAFRDRLNLVIARDRPAAFV